MKTLLCLVAIASLSYSYGQSKTDICLRVEEALDILHPNATIMKIGFPYTFVQKPAKETYNEHCIEKYSIELQNLSKKYTDLQQLSTAIVHLKIILIDHLLKKKDCPTKRIKVNPFLKSLAEFLTITGKNCNKQ